MSTTIYVTYSGTSGDRFDRDYWLGSHFALVREVWGPHGLESVSGFFPVGEDGGTIAIAPVRFRDEAAMRGALAAPGTERIMDDIRHFTDIRPARHKAVEL